MEIKYLLHELAHGDSTAAMKIIFVYFYSKLMLFVYSLVRSRQDTEEIVMNTFHVIWEQRLKLAMIQNPTSYIYAIARNNALDYLKQRDKNRHLFEKDALERLIFADPEFDPEKEFVEAELMDRLRAAVDSLPERTRIAFKLVREQGLRYQEAARIMEISVKTLEAHMASATKRLMSILIE